MSSDRTVLEHLLDGRNALVSEVKRLTTAIEELDSVISRIGGGAPLTDSGDAAASATEPSTVEPVNAEVEVDPVTVRPAKKAAARVRKAPARKAVASPRSSERTGTARTSDAARPGAPKSIRVHVLEMLAAEDRDFGLAEIIDRIHAEGIQAHDDAVRSITIKLMKDGRVERVGRGLYRLTRRGGTAAAEPVAPAAPTPAPADYVPPLDLEQSWQRPDS